MISIKQGRKKTRKATLLTLSILFASSHIYAQEVAAGVYDAVVAADASGDYTSIQKAIDHAPSNRTEPYLIFVKSGDYKEVLVVPEDKPHIHLIGQDKDKTVIHYKLNVQGQPKEDSKWFQNDTAAWKYSVHNPEAEVYRYPGTMTSIEASDFYAENLSFINDWGVESQNGPQALAIWVQADRNAFNNCVFRSFQDTWRTSKKSDHRLYASNCWIEGAVDYFYGGGNAYVEHSTFYNVRSGSVIIAPKQLEETPWGYVFDHCIIDGNAAAADGKQLLGRPWGDRPKAVFLNTITKIPLAPQGWTDMGGLPIVFADYKTVDASGKPVDTDKRKTQFTNRNNQETLVSKAVLTDEEAARYTYNNVLSGTDNWNPRAMIAALEKPVLSRSGKQLIWTTVADAKGYVLLKGEQVIAFSSGNNYTIEGQGNYQVQAVSASGSLGPKSDPCQ